MAVNFGPPENQSDDEVLEALEFWKGRQRAFAAQNEPDGVAAAREEVQKYEQEAEKRGLIRPSH